MRAALERKAVSLSRFQALAAATALAAGLAAGPLQAQPVGTAFTYQGLLTDAGNPADGAYDLQLALFDAASGGAQVGPTLTRDDVAVASGLFTVSLDFGGVFAGNKRWLEIRVRPGASTGAYTTLGGRQELTPGPNAVFAAGAPWAGVSGKPAGFADDTDDDTLGGLLCANGQIAKRAAGVWACTADADTTYTAGSGLALVGTIFSLSDLGVTTPKLADGAVTSAKIADATVALADLGQNGCAGGQVMKWSGAAWACAADAIGTGTVTSVTAGTGLTGGTITGAGTLAVSFGGGGAATTVARSDHDHFSQAWSGSSTTALTLTNAGGAAVRGLTTATDASPGIFGSSQSTVGIGVHGQASATGGTPIGVQGMAQSTGGFGGFFQNTGGGAALGLSGGGIRFSDGTTQTTAAVGDVTGVTAGIGLTGGAASGNATLSVNFGGSGTSDQVSRANHDHIGGFWSGPGGLYFDNTYPGEPGFWNDTLVITVIGSQSRAMVAHATPSTGQNVGVWGQSDSSSGFGVLGYAPAASGVNYGVYGRSDSPTGYAGFFEGVQVAIPSGKLTFAGSGPTRQLIDLRSPAYGIGQQGGVLYFRTEPPGGNFTWFLGGSHSNVQNDPGPGGFRQMRLDGGGNLFVRGSFFPGGADFAEMLAAEAGLEPGDVLAIGPDGTLTRSTEPYQDSLAGVYSTKPGLVAGAPDGESTEGRIPLAVAGVVPVKVTDEGGPIAAGDALTSSSTPGHAMKAAKVRVGGIAFFPSGVVIGKAIEPLHSGNGVIRALVVLQ